MSATAALIWLAVGAFLVGAATGSFAGVLIERLPARQTIGGRSNCVCGRQLRWWENLPVASYLLLRGRAQCCGARIPAWYLGLEAGFGLLAVAAVLAPVPRAVSVPAALVIAAALVAIAVARRRSGLPTSTEAD